MVRDAQTHGAQAQTGTCGALHTGPTVAAQDLAFLAQAVGRSGSFTVLWLGFVNGSTGRVTPGGPDCTGKRVRRLVSLGLIRLASQAPNVQGFALTDEGRAALFP